PRSLPSGYSSESPLYWPSRQPQGTPFTQSIRHALIGRLDLSVPPGNLLVELGDAPGELVDGAADHHTAALQRASHRRGRVGGLTHALGRIPMDQRPGALVCQRDIVA